MYVLYVDVGLCIVLYCTLYEGVCIICWCGCVYCMVLYVVCGCTCCDAHYVYVYVVEEKALGVAGWH